MLSSGQWAKLGVTSKGIYKIDRDVLSNAGFAVGSLDANKIQLFGYGGGMLPQSNAVARPNDLLENAIYTEGLEDGSFDQNDYILFYAQGPSIEYIDRDGKFFYQQNLYADTSYYFITVGEHNGKRMENLPNLGSALPEINSYTHYLYHELDRVNILSSGREWFGEFMTASNPIRIEFENTPKMLAGSEITMVSTVVNRSQDQGDFNYNINGTPVGSIEADGIGPGTYDDKGVMVTDTLTVNASQLNNQQGNMNVVIIYRGAGNGLLDYLTVSYESPLEMIGHSVMFRSPSSLDHFSSTYRISNANSNVVIWGRDRPPIGGHSGVQPGS